MVDIVYCYWSLAFLVPEPVGVIKECREHCMNSHRDTGVIKYKTLANIGIIYVIKEPAVTSLSDAPI